MLLRIPGILAVVAILFSSGPGMTDDWTDLRYYAAGSDIAHVSAMLDRGVDVNMRNDEGWTALMIAAEAGDAAMVRFLLSRGADPSIANTRGRTAYDVTLSSEIKRLVGPAAPAPSPTQPPRAGAPATTPALTGMPAGVTNAGQPATGRRSDAASVLQARNAIWYNNPAELERWLDQEGLDINARDSTGGTLLASAAYRDKPEFVRYLLSRGADPSIRDNTGKTAADYASSPEVRGILGAGAARQSSASQERRDFCQSQYRAAVAAFCSDDTCRMRENRKWTQCLQTGRYN